MGTRSTGRLGVYHLGEKLSTTSEKRGEGQDVPFNPAENNHYQTQS